MWSKNLQQSKQEVSDAKDIEVYTEQMKSLMVLGEKQKQKDYNSWPGSK